MSLSSGDRLGIYEVVAKVGEGGMGEVYQARDTKLHRLVALKTLPAGFAADTDRLARFRREAQVLASLNHPNIAAIYGFEDAGATPALVMEFVPGRTLADVAASPMALPEALGIARQIATALEAAHEQNIVHRDLKPANIKITDDGTVKVLDFGLAKALDQAGTPGGELGPWALGRGPDVAPTMTSPARLRPGFGEAGTGIGVILGTARYMAPEQAKGRPVDRRADIWALGVMLFEMLTGRALYRGDTVTETIAHVITQPPAWESLPAATPPAVRRLLRRCLEKDPKNRLQSAGDVRLEIDECLAAPVADLSTPGVVTVTAQPPRGQRVLPWALAALLLAALGMTLWALWPRATTPPRPMRLDVRLSGETLAINDNFDGAVAVISPDGQTLAYHGWGEKGRLLYLRSLDRLESVPVSGSENATQPFFSPDSRSIGFVTTTGIKRVAIAGGAPLPVATTTVPEARGATWGPGDVIVSALSATSGLSKVPAGGGTPVALTTLAPGERTHRWPHFLPDGNAVLFMCQRHDATYDDGTIEVVRLDTGARTVLVKGGTAPIYVPGYLLYTRRNSVFAMRFDPASLEVSGEQQLVQAGVMSSGGGMGSGIGNGSSQISIAGDGTMVYIAGTSPAAANLKLQIVDRAGNPLYTYKERLPFRDPRFSPDGTLIALRVSDGKTEQIHVLDPARGPLSKLPFDGSFNMLPVWSHDGKRLAFACDRAGSGTLEVCLGSRDGTGTVTTFKSAGNALMPTSFSSDDTHLSVIRINPRTGLDLLTLSIADGRTTTFLETPALEGMGQFRPDGKWIAYQSQDAPNARSAVFVRAWPGAGSLRQVSEGAGMMPFWTKEGLEIVYASGSAGRVTVRAVSVKNAGDALELGKPVELFTLPIATPEAAYWYHVTDDGARFVVALEEPGNVAPERKHVTVVFNFLEEIRRQLAK
jgi:serine/threonine-protein kinase